MRTWPRAGALLSCLLLSAASSGSARVQREAAEPGAGYLKMASLGMETLDSWYNWPAGRWNTTGWWNSANALTVLVNFSRLSGSTWYLPVVENTYAKNAGGGFLNDYYDDEGWWALDRMYKNAIANELFLSVAAHLANRVIDPDQQAQDLAWAEWEWPPG